MSLSDSGHNPYVDIRTGTYHNKVDASSPEALKSREDTFSTLRAAELRRYPVEGDFDLPHLKEINRRLLQDVYAWAGEPRSDFDAAKQEYAGGPAHSFTPSVQIERESSRIFEKLAAADYLQGCSRPDFVSQLARLHGEVNQMHAFPEGNGRTQRLFLEQVAQKAGHPVDLSIGTQERIVQASIAQSNGQHGMMERLVAEAADPDRVRALRTAIDHLNEVWGKDRVTQTYVASTAPGQKYAGILYGKAGTDFILRTDDRKLIVGHTVDLAPNTLGGQRAEFIAANGVNPH